MERHVKIDDKQHRSSLLDHLNKLRKNGEQCDFIIKVQSDEIPAHRNILAAGSEYFRAMLSHDVQENRLNVACMQETDLTSVKKCIDFIYTGKASMLEEELEPMMHVSTLMQLDDLRWGIVELLEADLVPESFLSTKKLANKYSCRQLEDKCGQFALENFIRIASLEDFNQLDKSYLFFLISSKVLQVAEKFKLKACLNWINHDTENRQKYILEILKVLNMNKIPLSYRQYLFENEPLITDSIDCLKILIRSMFESANMEARDVEYGKNNAICSFDLKSKTLQAFDPIRENWKSMQNLHPNITNHSFSAVALNDYIYVLMHDKCVYRLLYFDSKAVWEQMAEMNDNHGNIPNAVVFGDMIYVFGIQNQSSKIMERYDPSQNTWEKLPDRKTVNLGDSLVSTERFIYSVGGWNGCTVSVPQERRSYRTEAQIVFNVLERFEPLTSEWLNMAPMKTPRYSSAAAEYDKGIFVMGGLNKQQLAITDVECYTPSTDTWEHITPMKFSRSSFNASALNGILYVVGGGNNSIEVLDRDKNSWETVGNMQGMTIVNHSNVAVNI